MCRRWNAQQKALAAILFDGQLTPIVSRLLMLDELRNSNRQSNGPRSSDSRNQGVEIERLKQVKQMLFHLRGSIEGIFYTVNKTSNATSNENAPPLQAHQVHTKLMNQLNGISLPLLNILQPKQDTNETIDYVRRSIGYATIEEAASTLASLWKITRIVDESNNCIKSLALPILVSSTMALSFLEISKDVKLTPENEEKETNVNDCVMDRGEDCAIALLQLIRTIFADDPNRIVGDSNDELLPLASVGINENPSSFATALSNEVGNAIGGSLVARLVLSCLSLLAQDSAIPSASAIIRKPKEKSATLQLESLKTIHVCLEGIPMQDLWKSMLPGCFAVRGQYD